MGDVACREDEVRAFPFVPLPGDGVAHGAVRWAATFDSVLPIAKQERVGAINWRLVAGQTQTFLPWDWWLHPYVLHQPAVCFHEVLRTTHRGRATGSPQYRAER